MEPDTMLEIKGLERPVVLWNSKVEVNRIAATDVAEWIYTILTRTTVSMNGGCRRESSRDDLGGSWDIY